MKDFRLLDEARKARDSAAAAASDLARQAGEKAEALKTKATDVKEQLAEQASEMSDLGVTKLNETLGELNASLPILREAGYVIDGVTIKLGIPPKIVANFSGGSEVSGERIEALLAEHADRTLTTLLVKSVYHATKLQSLVNVKGLRPTGVSVEIGLVPSVAVKFGRASSGPRLEEPDQNAPTAALPASTAVPNPV
jgi:hypothetical protein